MMLLPYMVSEKEYNMIVVLQPENLARMKENDPAVVEFNKLRAKMKLPEASLRDLVVVTPTPEDLEIAMDLIQTKGIQQGLRHLVRGYKDVVGDGNPYQELKFKDFLF